MGGSRESFGHPAEWISDQKRKIAGILWSVEDAVRDHLGHSPVASPGRAEARLVVTAWRYLLGQFEVLVNYPGTLAAFGEIEETHNILYGSLGRSKDIRRLPTPCPGCKQVGSLRWTVDYGVDQISCETAGCDRKIKPEHYLFLARMALDDLIEEAEAASSA